MKVEFTAEESIFKKWIKTKKPYWKVKKFQRRIKVRNRKE